MSMLHFFITPIIEHLLHQRLLSMPSLSDKIVNKEGIAFWGMDRM